MKRLVAQLLIRNIIDLLTNPPFRVVSAAIERAKLQDFKMELAGVRRHYTTLSEVTAGYRSSENTAGVSKEQANVLYNHVFDELDTFGKLSSLVEQKCTLPLGANTKDDRVMRAIYDCLAFVDLYTELSILRKLVLVDIASLLKSKYGATADNVIEMYRKEFETDMELLRFLIDPINYPSSRLVVASFYQQRHRHESTAHFLNILATVFPQFKSKGVVVCLEEALAGQCYQMKEVRDNFHKRNAYSCGKSSILFQMILNINGRGVNHSKKSKQSRKNM